MLPQHIVYKNELNREYVISLARNEETPWWWSEKIEICRSGFKCFKWKLFKFICWLIAEVILRNARCNDEIRGYYLFSITTGMNHLKILICPTFRASVRSKMQAETCNTVTTPTQPHRNSNTHRTKNNTINVVIQQNSRKLLMVDILMSETCWAHKRWNKIASDIKLVFYSSTIIMMQGPINIRFTGKIVHYTLNVVFCRPTAKEWSLCGWRFIAWA